MFGTLGMPELLFILVLALLVFGPKRLPQVGKTLGKGLREFRRATNELKRTVDTEIAAVDAEPIRPTPATAPPRVTALPIESELASTEKLEAEPAEAETTDAEPPVESESTKKTDSIPATAGPADSVTETAESADAE
jgi:TatA/E family protein of Tat protein translocase